MMLLRARTSGGVASFSFDDIRTERGGFLGGIFVVVDVLGVVETTCKDFEVILGFLVVAWRGKLLSSSTRLFLAISNLINLLCFQTQIL